MRGLWFPLSVPLIVLCVLIPGVVHAMPLSVPCSNVGCTSDSYWQTSMNGAQVEVVAYQGNLPTNSWMDDGMYLYNSTGEQIFVFLTVSNNENTLDCGLNTHGHVYWYIAFWNSSGQDIASDCGDIGSVNYGQEMFLFINKYASYGGGAQALVCTVDCTTASGSEIVEKFQVPSVQYVYHWPMNTEYIQSTFKDDGTSYNNNTYPKDVFSYSHYQDTGGNWHEWSGNPLIGNGGSNPIQWYNGTSIAGGDAIFCDETKGQTTCS